MTISNDENSVDAVAISMKFGTGIGNRIAYIHSKFERLAPLQSEDLTNPPLTSHQLLIVNHENEYNIGDTGMLLLSLFPMFGPWFEDGLNYSNSKYGESTYCQTCFIISHILT